MGTSVGCGFGCMRHLIVSDGFNAQMRRKDRLRVIDIFRRSDTNGDGVITLKELRNFADSQKLQLKDGQLEAILSSLDEDGNGVLDFVEFERACALYNEHVKRQRSRQPLK
jgi:calmodulin